MKVADFYLSEINLELHKFLMLFVWYQDNILSEDLINPEDARQSDHYEKLSVQSKKQLQTIINMCKRKDCAYIRFISDSGPRSLPLVPVTEN
jgi:hypothetical protein